MKAKLTLSVIFTLMSLLALRADDSFLWEGGSDTGDVWKFSPSLGWISTNSYPWVWIDKEQNWLWFVDQGSSNDASNVWCWDDAIAAWRWQDLNEYPWVLYWTGLNYEWVFISEANSYYLESRDESFSAEELSSYCAGMVAIKAGTFTMGDSFLEGNSHELPLHDVTLSSFYMGRTEVTNAEVAEVLNWANNEDLLIVSSTTVENAEGDAQELLDLDVSYCQISWNGSSFVVDSTKDNYPCIFISWYGSAAYANYLSEKEGLSPCYDLSDWSCDFSANGYRLPTEAEWEYAARGGLNGARFPRGDTITHEDANYYSYSSDSYDLSTTREFHPDYNTGTYPYSSPVGSLDSNGYGLYNIAGNVQEWCNDWYASNYYNSSLATNPSGPTSGDYCVIRGGYWISYALFCRVAYRSWNSPEYSSYIIGFRLSKGL